MESHHVANSDVGSDESGIVLRWLARLRWLAVVGQTIATLIAVFFLKLNLPLVWIVAIIGMTAVSNLALVIWIRLAAPRWLVPAVLVLDICLLTALLVSTGGPANPFSTLYLVHVAMAVVTLTEGWSWLVAGAATACYGLLFVWHPRGGHSLGLGPITSAAADWVALTLVAIVIAYFVGRMTRSLRRHEQALTDAKDRASRNEQLAALTTLSAGAAHELNTPLSTIAVVAKELEVQSGRLELSDAQHGENLAKDARLIRQEVDRCQYILSRMRVDVLQGETSKSPSPVTGLLADLRRQLSSEMGKSLRINCGKDLDETAVPSQALHQALSILVDNAIDASGPGKTVELSIYARNGQLVFEVSDEGTGMTPEVSRRAGEPFFTTKPPGQGMGLGLFLARLLVEKLGGSLALQSKPGLGTRAILELPRT